MFYCMFYFYLWSLLKSRRCRWRRPRDHPRSWPPELDVCVLLNLSQKLRRRRRGGGAGNWHLYNLSTTTAYIQLTDKSDMYWRRKNAAERLLEVGDLVNWRHVTDKQSVATRFPIVWSVNFCHCGAPSVTSPDWKNPDAEQGRNSGGTVVSVAMIGIICLRTTPSGANYQQASRRSWTRSAALWTIVRPAWSEDCGTLYMIYSGWIRTLDIVTVGCYSLRGTRLTRHAWLYTDH